MLEPVVCTVLPKLALSLLHTTSYLSHELSISKCTELFGISLSGSLGHLKSTWNQSKLSEVPCLNMFLKQITGREFLFDAKYIYTTGSNIALLGGAL